MVVGRKGQGAMFGTSDRRFVRTFFTSPAAVEGDDSAEMLRKAAGLRGLEAPDVWVPDNEDATAPSLRDEGVENIINVVSEAGAAFPGEIHPRVVWHRDDPAARRRGLEHIRHLADPEAGAIEHIDGVVIPEVGTLDDWKKADEFLTLAEDEYGLAPGRLRMSVVVESAEAELALEDLYEEMGKPSNRLERLFMLVDGEVDYTKDMGAMTPTGDLPPWPTLRHNTARGASAVDLIAVDGPYDDIRDLEGYRERMIDNHAKGMLGIWALTPAQVRAANVTPLPPADRTYRLGVGGDTVDLEERSGRYVYEGDGLSLEEIDDDTYRLSGDGRERTLEKSELVNAIDGRLEYAASLGDIVDAMERFEQAKAEGRGAISIAREATIEIEGTRIEVARERMWDEATYQAAATPITLLQEVWHERPDQHEALTERYGAELVERARQVG